MEEKKKFLKYYLFIALLFGILSIIDSIATPFFEASKNYDLIIGVVYLLFILFNIIALFIFQVKKTEKIAYVLPIYHLIGFFFFLVIGLVISSFEGVTQIFEISLLILSIILSLFEIVFSIYLLRKFQIM